MDQLRGPVKPGGRTRRALLAAAAALAVAAACGRGEPEAPFSSTFDSPEALAEALLDGLHQRDRSRLERLMLSETEFREAVWPHLPASQSGRNVPVEYAWGQLEQRSNGAFARLLAEHGGRRYELVDIEFTGRPDDHRSFTVRRASRLTVRGETGGPEQLRLFGSAIEQRGRWKIFSYVID